MCIPLGTTPAVEQTIHLPRGDSSPYPRCYAAAAHLRIPAATSLPRRAISVSPLLRRHARNAHANAAPPLFQHKSSPPKLRAAYDRVAHCTADRGSCRALSLWRPEIGERAPIRPRLGVKAGGKRARAGREDDWRSGRSHPPP